MCFDWMQFIGVRINFPGPRVHFWYSRQVMNPKAIKRLASQIARIVVTTKRILPKGRRWRGDVGVMT